MTSVLIVDALAHGSGRRLSTIDLIGAGPRTIAGVLEKKGVYTRIIPGELFLRGKEDLDKYDFLMISGMSSDLMGVSKIIGLWRSHRGRDPVIIGGPLSLEENILLFLDADILVYGEAEATVDELFSILLNYSREFTYELEGVRGISYRVGRRIRSNPLRRLLSSSELDKYRPSCDRIVDYPGFWYKRVYVEVVRGCSNVVIAREALEYPEVRKPKRLYPGCAYCSVVSLWGPSRSMSIDRIVYDINCLVKRGVRRIVLSAPDFLDYGRDEFFPYKRMALNPIYPPANIERLETLLQSIFDIPLIRRGETVVLIENLKPCLITEEVAKLLGKYFKGTSVNIGVESADEELLKSMGRPCSYKDSLKAINLLRKNGIKVHAYLLYGLPGQGKRSIDITINSLEELVAAGIKKFTLYRFTPLPRSMLENASKGNPQLPWNKVLIKKVRETNYVLKKELVGKKVNVVIVSWKNGYYWGYMWPESLVVRGIGGKNISRKIIGSLAKLLVTRVVNDRIIEGKVLHALKRISKRSSWGVY